VIIGSDPMVSHLVFEQDSGISAAHCEILLEAGCLYLRDLVSTTGTYLNGVALTDRQRIEEQDVLRIGRTEMRITFPN
jgi:pSer/pThr/pTyr-binding forkhead associated (FHA) protein